MNENKRNNGITLIALIVTIIVLLILAGVAISTLTGDNGILTRATDTKTQTELSRIEEEANIEYEAQVLERQGSSEGIRLENILENIKEKVNYECVMPSGSTITGISLNNSTISISTNGTATITVSYDGETSGNSYYAVINGKYYLMELKDKGVKVSRTASNISSSSNTDELKASSSDSSFVTVDSINGNTITLNGGENVGNSKITVSYGEFEEECIASVVVMPTSTSEVKDDTKFSTEYGKIDVIWLSKASNTVTSTPNAPNLSGMTPVSWTKSEDEWSEDQTASESYYNYKAGSLNTDNTSSHWANAKNSDGSYFVWIPRYAYRITYYSGFTIDDNGNAVPTGNPTGFYDGWGQWEASSGSVRLKLDSGIETVDYNGNKYIVHPAFCGTSVGYDNGSWSTAISGFWVAKYEMSKSSSDSTKAVSLPNASSWTYIDIGDCYTTAKSYDTSKESHLMKNSEWGAVAYLTQSQYGRNGNEIDNNATCTTGLGSGDSNPYGSGQNYSYNTTIGARASTTGNVYGVYDMSGGAYEYVAVFNEIDSNGNESKYGSSFAATKDEEGIQTINNSNEYATKYSNKETSTNVNSIIYTYGKIGDATKEVNKGGNYDMNASTGSYSYSSDFKNWFNDYPGICSSGSPFIARGGYTWYDSVGLFCSFTGPGSGRQFGSFRAVLCP